jgi:thioredoxin reductase (NADPH)
MDVSRLAIDGLYAAGDVVSDLHQIGVATGHAAIAATHIHKMLPAIRPDGSGAPNGSLASAVL